jgi:hypothetical protein
MNHQEWYISKKWSPPNNFTTGGEKIFRYSSGGAFWGIRVPITDADASPISRKTVSFREQKRFQKEFKKPVFFVVKGFSRRVAGFWILY